MMMTIAIAPLIARPSAQGGKTDSAAINETPVADADFASLLLGQLAIGTDLHQGIVDNNPASIDLLDARQLDSSATPQDAAMLLATLGIAPPQANGKAATDEENTDTLVTDTLVIVDDGKTPQTLVTIAPNNPASTQLEKATGSFQGNAPSEPNSAPTKLNTDLETDTAIRSALPEIGDKAAKFAVREFIEPKADSLPIKNLPTDTSTSPASVSATFPANQPVHTAPFSNQSLRVDTPVRDLAWSGDFSQKVVWLTSNDQKFAQLTLNPPQMGPIEISLNINKDNASASAYFVSPNAEVREAIETALPRLREMLAGVGIELGQANVGAQSSRQDNGSQETRQGAPRWLADGDILGVDSRRSQAIITQRGNSLVDTFA
jgi:flagellar hook-length control protein FliK